MIDPVCDQRSSQNSVELYFVKNTFLKRKMIFPKLIFENEKEKHVYVFSRTYKNMKDVCVCGNLKSYQANFLSFNKAINPILKIQNT